jgi:hypothetical protein
MFFSAGLVGCGAGLGGLSFASYSVIHASQHEIPLEAVLLWQPQDNCTPQLLHNFIILIFDYKY